MPPRKLQEPAIAVRAFSSIEEMDRAIGKLERRVVEVQKLADRSWDDPAVATAESNISSAILEIYGPSSPEYADYQYHQISRGPQFVDDGPHEHDARLQNGIPYTIGLLRGLIGTLQERKIDLADDPVARARITFESLDLHPRIGAVAADLFRDSHYRNAVADAAIALINAVKEKSRRHDLDGATLMTTVFSQKNPVLAFNDLVDRTDEDEQQGMMFLFAGMALAIRNPRSHALRADTAEAALNALNFLSLLAKSLDAARLVKSKAQPAKS